MNEEEPVFKETEEVSLKDYQADFPKPMFRSRQADIQRDANLEALVRWAMNKEEPPLPKMPICDPLKPSVGLYNFFKDILLTNAKQLLP